MNALSIDKNKRILVIDDNQAVHEDFRKILGLNETDAASLDKAEEALFGGAPTTRKAEGFDIDSAYQGQEALKLVREAVQAGCPYAMAFVDIRMPPGWDGLETILRLWQDDPDLQVVICTAYSDYTWQEIIGKLGIADRLLILKKPFDNIEVRQLASALTQKWKVIRQTRQKIDDLHEVVQERTDELQQQKRHLEDTVEQLNQVHTQLLQAQKLESIGQLAAGIAHEINTPTQFVGDNIRFLHDAFSDLRTLLAKYEQLLEASRENQPPPELVAEADAAVEEADVEYLTEEVPKAIDQSLEGVERVAKIVRSMKEFSHPGGEDKQAADLNKAIETTVTVARNEWKYVTEMVTDFDPSLPLVPCLIGDFNQVVLNMIINAAHSIKDVVGHNTGKKGTITIATRQDGDWAKICISDTGTGMPAEIRSKVFDPFFTTKDVGKGTGQGLAIAHTVIVKKHGGRIDVESEVGRGTTFIIRLPIESALDEQAGVECREEAHSLR